MVGKITNKTLFYSWVNEYLQGPGASYRKDVRITNGSGSMQQIIVRQFSCIPCVNAKYNDVVNNYSPR